MHHANRSRADIARSVRACVQAGTCSIATVAPLNVARERRGLDRIALVGVTSAAVMRTAPTRKLRQATAIACVTAKTRRAAAATTTPSTDSQWVQVKARALAALERVPVTYSGSRSA